MLEVRSTASAISKLTEDVLWHTFYFVAQVLDLSCHDSSELTDLRRASQVCASWRRLLLASSSLWGMAIDLNQLGQRTCHWREEVLRRTGNSLLDIHGFINAVTIVVLERFLASLLNDHWPRIRRLALRKDYLPRGNKTINSAMESAFQKTAPYLESFLVDLDVGSYSPDFSSTTFRLFADQAPNLQECTCPRLLQLDPQKLWLSNLRVLEFTCHWTARVLLCTLASMPLLEILQVVEKEDGEQEDIKLHAGGRTNLSRVTLPRLKSFSVKPGTALQKYLTVLEQLVLAPKLRLIINTQSTLVRADVMAIQQIFTTHLHNSFKGNFPNDLSITHCQDFILIHLYRDSHEFKFCLLFWCGEGVQPMDMFLESLRTISIEHTTKLSLTIKSKSDTGALALAKTTFNSTISSMVSIKELDVTNTSLELLLSFPTATGNILFPLLKALQLHGRCDVAFLLDYLTQRRALGLPIQSLDFSSNQPLQEHRGDIRRLEQFDGLKVTWSPHYEDEDHEVHDSHEYICGSGNPDVLYYYIERS
ncbi:hypothetical protein GALMADRAFT_139473 [Galerina marginata CBS 339.88]|uniref:F-box domain-containing protein n=1 Tax=Galerina marginata (strain CBS 339.88) TaxID=685588 RepID=A0A067T2L5_GALM3|nr:hypothetical protein GALMADRAFT_139473 [Galerina marginata CBS 339.88]